MNKDGKYVIKTIKILILVVMGIILIVSSSVILLKIRSAHQENEDKRLLQWFGEVTTNIQMISKDGIELTYLRSLSEIDIDTESIEIDRAITKKSKELTRKLNQMEHMMRGFREGNITNDQQMCDDVVYLWSKLDSCFKIILEEDSSVKERKEAYSYILSQNVTVTTLIDQLQQDLMEESISNQTKIRAIEIALVIFLGAYLMISLIHMNRFVIVPYQRIYQGLSEIGLHQSKNTIQLPTEQKVDPILLDINKTFLKINHLLSLMENMNSHTSFHESLDFIYHTFSEYIPYNYIGIALFDDKKKMLKASYGVSDGTVIGLPDNILGHTWSVEGTSLLNLIETGETRVINDLLLYTQGKPLNSYNQIILNAGIRSSITLPLKLSGEPVGVIFFSSTKKNVYNDEHVKFLSALVNSIAVSFHQNIFIDELLISSILALAKLAEARDEDTGDHLNRMKVYSRMIAELLFVHKIYPDETSVDFIEKIERFSPLHDIGKVGIRDEILLKPGKLTTDEITEMRQHAVYGAEVLKAAENNITKLGRNLFDIGIEIAEGHHEKWDGSGYPHGKKRYEIPLSARIVAVADVFDALTSKRPYKEAFPFERAIDIMEEGRGKHFDPTIVDVFLEHKYRFESIMNEFHRDKK